MPEAPLAPLRVLVLTDTYLPAYRGGGPVRTVANLVSRLGDRIEFRIITSDRDGRDARPFPDVERDRWVSRGGTECLYLRRHRRHVTGLRAAVLSRPHDVLYLNSLFASSFAVQPLLLRRAGLLTSAPVVLAPRGELSPAALGLKRAQKQLFLRGARAIGLHGGVLWQATNELEAEQIREHFGREVAIHVAPNLAAPPVTRTVERRPKRGGELRLVWLARVVPMKNLEGALDLLDGLEGDITLDVHGPLDEPAYWRRCQARIATLPANVRVRACGPVAFDAIADVLGRYDFFLLPTLGENFGHAIVEALSAGCPVLVSDRTPWRGLETHGVGWDLPLDDRARWRAVLRHCVAMDEESRRRMSDAARARGAALAADREGEAANLELLRRASEGAATGVPGRPGTSRAGRR